MSKKPNLQAAEAAEVALEVARRVSLVVRENPRELI